MEDAPARRGSGADISSVTLDGADAPRSSAGSYLPGERIADRYQLIRMLDQGGMGVVWVAHHLALDVHVALKLVRPDAGSEQAAARLLLEAQMAARLNHPAILRVLDVGKTAAGDPFLVMELLEGECLADVLERDVRVEPITSVRTILPIADALAALHGKGIIHRDVKPENIFLARSDSGRWQPKLIDFGAAKLDQQQLKRITKRGMTVGTPSYMSPEQLKGEDADTQSDVWALSVVLYEMLAGELPFDAETHGMLLMAMLEEPPKPFFAPGVDDELWAILRRGLVAKEARWPSVRELGKALAQWLWDRQVMADIGGVALAPGWLGVSEVGERRPSASQPSLWPGGEWTVDQTRESFAGAAQVDLATSPTLEFPVEVTEVVPAPVPPTIALRPSALAQSVVAPAVAPSVVVPAVVPSRPRWHFLAGGVVVAALGAGLLAALGSARSSPPAPPAPPVVAPAVSPPAPPAIAAPVAVPPTAAVTAEPSASSSIASKPVPAPVPPRPRARPKGSTLPSELKDPFH